MDLNKSLIMLMLLHYTVRVHIVNIIPLWNYIDRLMQKRRYFKHAPIPDG